ncbi:MULTISPECIES: phage integrase [Klebsiella pneumoniae complex]|uniref:phage integrase n=1 Tax=Klebsiella pneumoniae complex TaxID=3390273 RepID=UPI001495B6FD|nr:MULTISPECIES: tyrosine-type recombinase/integrase [Klebsiella]WNN06912.1 tyrosine-type recombinase/integrase [Klebsiella variicola]HDH0516399.1 tyrosine-type recombinase/integrase [Klebsiella pneumoniae]HDH0531726.1 tyrosine-type recombinase/integrase [Klebsiella pneumoniae]
MSIKKLDDGRYMVDIRPRGAAGRRIRRTFDRKAEATAFEQYTIANASQKEWAGKRADRRPLSELLDAWWRYHGQNHENGKKEFNHLLKTISGLGDPAVSRLSKRDLMDYRSSRLNAGIKASTINREMYRLSGMFTKLIQIEEYSGQHPVNGLPPLAEENPEMTFLEREEISCLLNVLEGDYLLVALLCLSTGGRWSEVATLKRSNIVNCRVTFLKTKNGKKRTVPISEELENKVKKEASGKLFKVDYERFCKILREVKPDIPENQATHILRHTFASHFMMNGGNIIALQQILGHANIQQTMVYAHLSPDYLQNAVTLNPLQGGIAA